MKLVFSPPDPESPGYLKRSRDALELFEGFKENPSPKSVDKMVEFFLPFVTEPEDRKEAEDALWMASEIQIGELIQAILGGGENPTPSPEKNETK